MNYPLFSIISRSQTFSQSQLQQGKVSKIFSLIILTCSFILASCSDDNGNSPEPVETSSIYVTNEGNFTDSNGSLTSYEPSDGTTIQAAFEDANGRPLAGIIQSSYLVEDQLFIVLNAANKIEVVNSSTLNSLGTIEMADSPSAIHIIDEQTAYVSIFDNMATVDSVALVDLENMEDTGERIAVGDQPRSVVRVGNYAYVANSGDGNDNTVSVINVLQDTVVETLEVGAGPTQIVADEEDRLWVVCNGRIAYDENFERDPENDIPGSIYIIDGNEATIIDSVETGGHPSAIALNNEAAEAYLLNDGISIIDMNNLVLRDDFIDRSFNAIGYFPHQQHLYLGQSRGYDQEGQALIYDLGGTPIDSFSVGIAPNGFQFH